MTKQLGDVEQAAKVRLWQPDVHSRRAAAIRLLVVVLGVVACQAVLYGPSLIGVRVLLPLQTLRDPHVYLPATAETLQKSLLNDPAPTDLVYYYEPARQFAISELRAGRFPWWSPYEYGGVGCYRWNLSPPWLLGYLIASPVVLAWIQLFVALTAAGGAYVFFRRVLHVQFWPAAIVAWCYPLTGAYIFWQGFWLPSVMCWLPWVLTAVEATVRRPAGWGGPTLALFSGVTLASGAPDIAGQVLLASGIYAAGRLVQLFVFQRAQKLPGPWLARYAVGTTALAWAIGIVAGAWMLLPLAEYMQTGYRSVARSRGAEERPPLGIQELPQVVLPDMYGSYGRRSYRLIKRCIQESSAGAYSGMLATLLLAPLAFASRRHRSICVLASVLAFVGMSWELNVPGLVQLLRMPGLNLLSHNRFVFVTAFALLALAAVGLDVLWEGRVPRRGWFLAPMALLAVIAIWCVCRTAVLPEPVATKLPFTAQQGDPTGGHYDAAGATAVQSTFRRSYASTALLAAVGLAAWLWLWFQAMIPRWAFAVLGVLLVGDLLWFGYGRTEQEDPALYYPRLPVLEKLAAAEPGRVIGLDCLPANLAATHGLRDVRGYDGVDPARWVEILKPAADPTSKVLHYAAVEWMMPEGVLLPSGLVLHPILSMLNVRYVIARGSPKPGYHPLLAGGDYIVWENPGALPRAYVPKRVETVVDPKERIRRLSAVDFDPRATALVEQPLDVPGECRGSAAITGETPQRVTIETDMKTPGLIVLSDRWDPTWKAYLDGKQVPILCANHALCGVAAPAGRRELQFRYEPATLFWGSVLSGIAIFAWLAWVAIVARIQRRGMAECIDDWAALDEKVVTVSPDNDVAGPTPRATVSPKRGQARTKKGRR
jgi:hypothetical protein